MARASLVGALIAGRFKVTHLLGEGAMGQVYVAEHNVLGRQYAIKVLKERVESDEKLVERFRREAQATSRLDHPNIVFIADFGRMENGQLYLIMEYIPGHSLRDTMQGFLPGRLPLERSVEILRQLCGALGAAHDAGVVHRDIKPDNVLLGQGPSGGDLVKVLDFGLAKFMYSPEMRKLTRQGELFGSPLYMAPEQCRGDPIDHRVDIYSLGVMAFELFTSRPPFNYPSIPRMLMAHQREPVPAFSECLPRDEPLPDDLQQITQQCLAKERDARPNHARDVAQVLEAFLERQKEAAAAAGSYVPTREALRSDEQLQAVAQQPQPQPEPQQPQVQPQQVQPHAPAPAPPPPMPLPEAPADLGSAQARQEWYWSQAAKSARDLALRLRRHRLTPLDLSPILNRLDEIEDEMLSEEMDVALMTSQIEDVQATHRDPEARLRGAVVDLSAERGRLADSGAPDARHLSDLDYQIGELEKRLAELYHQRDAELDTIQMDLRLVQGRLSVLKQEQTELERNLFVMLGEHKPPQMPPGVSNAFQSMEALLRAVYGSWFASTQTLA